MRRLCYHQTNMMPGGVDPIAPHVNPDHAAIQRFCIAHDIQELALFGSVMRPDFTADSDIDVLVRFAPGAKVGLFELAQFEEALSRLFDRRRIDLRTINEIHPKLRPSSE